MKYYGITDRGLVRKNNQDSYVIATSRSGDLFAIVADGIGGNLGGDIASRMAVSHFSKVFSETNGFATEADVKDWIETQVSTANTMIYEYGVKRPGLKGMGTTLCGALITKSGIFIVNIGDSRAYAWGAGKPLHQITMDHTLVNDMLMHGQLTPEEAANFPRRNVLTNALGVWENVRSDIDVHHEAMSGLLLCSDGLHGYVDEEKISAIVHNKDMDPTQRSRRLLKAALDAGGYDNVTVVLIDFSGDNG
ncbi:MAG: Stp1/IreP family PP2C-type Ser/Thr phosphatase [Solobacterium sp.]|nr:Stp1/IreP family PP2C-type Ser/Thr phosphatase [Solobacterium sp.]MBQ9823679.1 Stp1/IreP family PP2C-type Ser/Thr phosphatase [Solobacterium sp.]